MKTKKTSYETKNKSKRKKSTNQRGKMPENREKYQLCKLQRKEREKKLKEKIEEMNMNGIPISFDDNGELIAPQEDEDEKEKEKGKKK